MGAGDCPQPGNARLSGYHSPCASYRAAWVGCAVVGPQNSGITVSLEAFARALAEGDTQLEAYCAAGFSGDKRAAGRLARRVDVRARIQELRADRASPAKFTVRALLDELEGIRVEALLADPPQANAAIQATMLKAHILGYGVTARKQERAIRSVSLELLWISL